MLSLEMSNAFRLASYWLVAIRSMMMLLVSRSQTTTFLPVILYDDIIVREVGSGEGPMPLLLSAQNQLVTSVSKKRA